VLHEDVRTNVLKLDRAIQFIERSARGLFRKISDSSLAQMHPSIAQRGFARATSSVSLVMILSTNAI